MVQGLNVFDPVDAVETEVQLVQRPDVLRRILLTSAGALGAGYYFGGGAFTNKALGKVVRALIASGLGINFGLYLGNPQLDAVGAAAAYYAIDAILRNLNGSSGDIFVKYEALGALVAGLAADRYANGLGCSCQN